MLPPRIVQKPTNRPFISNEGSSLPPVPTPDMRFAPPPSRYGGSGPNTLTNKPVRSVGADQVLVPSEEPPIEQSASCVTARPLVGRSSETLPRSRATNGTMRCRAFRTCVSALKVMLAPMRVAAVTASHPVSNRAVSPASLWRLRSSSWDNPAQLFREARAARRQ